MKKQLKYLIIAAILALSVASCIKDNFNFDKWDREVEYDASFAAPGVWGDVAFIDVVELYDSTGLLIENDEGYVSLQYKTSVSSNAVNEIIYLEDQNINGVIQTLDFDFTGFDNSGDTVSIAYTEDMPITMFNPDAEIDSATLRTGILNMTAVSNYQHAARIYLTMPSVTKNGQPFSEDFIFTPGGHASSSLNNDFTGYTIDMTQTATGFNEIPVEIRVTLYRASDDNSGSLSFDTDMIEMQYEIMHGYFGENTLFFESDTISISLFRNDDFNIDEYMFVDPKFHVNYWNSYGIPSQFYFTHLTANSAINDNDIPVEGTGMPIGDINPYNVSYATIIGETKLDSIKLHKDNSNIDYVVNQRPKWVQFKAKATTNPAGLDHHNFVVYDSEIEVEVIMELPLWGYVYNFHSMDTTEADLSELENDYNPVTRALLRIDIQNGFPVEAFGQVYFCDENYVILDSLLYTYEERLLAAAEVDAEGRVLDFSRKITEIEFDQARIDKVDGCKHIIYSGQANTTNADEQELVKIYSDYRIKFDIGFEVDLELSGNLDSIQAAFGDTTTND